MCIRDRRGNGRSLRYGRRGKYDVFIDRLYRPDQVIRRYNIADAPTGHGEILGEAVYGYRPFPHSRNGEKRHKRRLIAEGRILIMID